MYRCQNWSRGLQPCKLLLLIVLFVCCQVTFALGNENQKSPWSGFRGIKWGTHKKEIADLVLLEKSGDLTCYTRKGEKLAIGKNAKLKEIVYLFYKDQFYMLTVKSKGWANHDALKAAVFVHYGKGHQPNQFVDEWIWTQGDVSMLLKYDSISEETILFMQHDPITKQKEKDESRAAKEAGSDF